MKIIVIGCGQVGAGVAQNLNERGHAVTVIDNNPDAFEQLGPAFKGNTIAGIGFDRDVLLQSGIERADGLAALTASDETNMVAAQLARQVFRVPKVVARVNHPRQGEIYHRLGLQTIAPTIWGINRMVDLLCHSSLDTILSLGNGEVDIVLAEVPPALVGRTVNELTLPGESSVVAVTRNGKAFLPTLGAVFQAGDLVHLATMPASASDRLNAMLELG